MEEVEVEDGHLESSLPARQGLKLLDSPGKCFDLLLPILKLLVLVLKHLHQLLNLVALALNDLVLPLNDFFSAPPLIEVAVSRHRRLLLKAAAPATWQNHSRHLIKKET